jgi:hypothetical protein
MDEVSKAIKVVLQLCTAIILAHCTLNPQPGFCILSLLGDLLIVKTCQLANKANLMFVTETI